MEKEDKRIRGKSIYTNFLEEWCRRTGKDISEIVTKNRRDVSELRGQSLDVVFFDEAAELDRATFDKLQRRAALKGSVCFVIQPGKVNPEKNILSMWGGLEIQEVDIYKRTGGAKNTLSG